MRLLLAPLLLAACGQAAPDRSTPVIMLEMDRLDIADGKGLYVGQYDGREVRVRFAVPLDRVDPARGHGSERVGVSADRRMVALVDRYATRSTGEGDRCANGREAWLRVFSLGKATELLATPIESCRDDVPAQDATWLDGDRVRVGKPGGPVYAVTDGGVRRL